MQRFLRAEDEDSRRRGSGQNFSTELGAKNAEIAVLTLFLRSTWGVADVVGEPAPLRHRPHPCLRRIRTGTGWSALARSRRARLPARADCLAGFGSAKLFTAPCRRPSTAHFAPVALARTMLPSSAASVR